MEKPLWAPWRMEFLQAEKPAGCIFCLFPAEQGEEADRRNLIVHRASRSFTILNRFPYNNGHVMVVPRAHVARLEDLLGGVAQKVAQSVAETMRAEMHRQSTTTEGPGVYFLAR